MSARTYDPDLDDIRSMLVDVCRTIGTQGDFLVSGFGEARWPLDVPTDLPVFLEQLPAVLSAVRQGTGAGLDFYEQGIERTISFTPMGKLYLATCTSWTAWQAAPASMTIARADLEQMLQNASDAFMHALQHMTPALARHAWVRQWLAGAAV
ncbi:hypothetical protein SAMN02745857_03110 [Andreprevotia lacus DSM 23236]|uniref:Uncharacterized protein n=1 Tax=Andreprevotia lacus DSM 23236 TaxID=1121001 RepID=A0A1W1XW29_9NEIS|nr:hypothetical protein [Andreprevotia lacus]SMC28087.1 hypothetical protein SAMN02745857_03110 [Andreprevotia lacus DSM 23236]